MTSINEQAFYALNLNISEYNTKEIEEAKALAAEVAKYHPAELFFVVSEYDGKSHFERPEIKLTGLHLDFTVSFSTYTKKYSIFCNSIRALPAIDNHDIYKTQRQFAEPNQIGVLKSKKIAAWITYWCLVYNALHNVSTERQSAVAAFRQTLAGQPVKWYDDKKTKGHIEKNGLVYRFEIGNSYVSQKIEISSSVAETLQNFLALSDNKIDNSKH